MTTPAYTAGLTGSDYKEYFDKLVLANGERLPEPYSIPDQLWVEDTSKWPCIEWPQIYSYLIEKPSVYTRESLQAYKSLDAVNYVLCGHVNKMKYYDAGEFCILRAAVLPSQRQGKKTLLYDAWVYVHKELGFILTANCTCMAG